MHLQLHYLKSEFYLSLKLERAKTQIQDIFKEVLTNQTPRTA